MQGNGRPRGIPHSASYQLHLAGSPGNAWWKVLIYKVTVQRWEMGSQEHSYTGYVNKVPATPNFLFKMKLPHPQPPVLRSRARLFFSQGWLLIGPGIGLWHECCPSKNQGKNGKDELNQLQKMRSIRFSPSGIWIEKHGDNEVASLENWSWNGVGAMEDYGQTNQSSEEAEQ